MKRAIISALLAVAVIISLVGCDNSKYDPVPSTEEEARIVMTFQVGEEVYGVRYELYRALFLSNRSTVDGGDASVWESDGAEEYVKQINGIIANRAYKIYSALELASSLGFDPYSSDVEAQISDYVKGAVEGDGTQLGHGSYEKYLESLKKNNTNYSVSVLLMRYSICMDYINKYYGGYIHENFGQMPGEYEYTREDVEEYYYSDECARFMQIYIDDEIHNYEWALSFRGELLTLDTDEERAIYIIGNTTVTEADIIYDGGISGTVLGTSELDSYFYGEYVERIFATKAGETSEVIRLDKTDSDGYYIIYGLEKDEEHFERCYEYVRASYVDNIIGSRLEEITNSFSETLKFTDNYLSIKHSEISMD